MIHIVTGPPCAGKTTYVREHAKSGDLRVDYDMIAQALGAENSHAAEGIVRQAAFEAREGAIRSALKSTDSESWIIHTTPSEEHVKLYEAAGAEFIPLDPGYDVCMERAKRDGRPQQTVDGIEKWYRGQKGCSMKHKTKEFGVKYADEGNGKIEGYASTWIRKADSYGDVVKQGAFTRTLKERWNGGKGIPLLWAHRMDDLAAFIGKADADEDEKGLHFVAEFDDTEEAQRVRELYKDGRLKSFSFAYDVKAAGQVTLEDGMKANELQDLDLYEISCVTVPANDDANVLDIKSGRRNSKSDADKLEQAIMLIRDVLGQLEDADEPESGEDNAEDNPAGEDQKQSNPKKAKLLAYIESLKTEE